MCVCVYEESFFLASCGCDVDVIASLTRSLTHSFTHTHTHSLTHSLLHSLTLFALPCSLLAFIHNARVWKDMCLCFSPVGKTGWPQAWRPSCCCHCAHTGACSSGLGVFRDAGKGKRTVAHACLASQRCMQALARVIVRFGFFFQASDRASLLQIKTEFDVLNQGSKLSIQLLTRSNVGNVSRQRVKAHGTMGIQQKAGGGAGLNVL